MPEQEQELVGWVSAPDGRGTLNIVYSCATVIVIAIWTILHPNVPARSDSLARTLLRRARWGVLAVFTPDLLTLVAALIYFFHPSVHHISFTILALRRPEWQNILSSFKLTRPPPGFVLQPPDNEPEFPVNAEQIHHLVRHGYLPFPTITRDEIWDKSKADLFAKAFALLQVSWIIIQSAARAAQGLSVSPLEVFTIAFVVSTTMSYFYWWNKPQDVRTPTVLRCAFSTAAIRADAGLSPDAPYEDSPLEFVGSSDYHEIKGGRNGNRVWERRKTFKTYDLERQASGLSTTTTVVSDAGAAAAAAAENRNDDSTEHREKDKDKSSASSEHITQTYLQRIPNDAILMNKLPLNVLLTLAIPSLIHSTVHLLGWNFTYPSATERVLWRMSAVILPSVSATAVAIVRMMEIRGYRGRYNLSWVWVNYRGRQQQDEKEKDKAGCIVAAAADQVWDVVLSFLVFLLALARLYIIVEAIVSLRNLPADVFVTVEWAELIPHV